MFSIKLHILHVWNNCRFQIPFFKDKVSVKENVSAFNMFTLQYKVTPSAGSDWVNDSNQEKTNHIPRHTFKPDQLLNCAHVESLLPCLSLISLIDNLFSPTELPLSIPNSERHSSWKSLEGSCFSETAALPHLAQTITQHSESLRSCSLPYCPLRFAEALVLPAWLLSGSQTVWKPISRFIKLTFTFKMKV